VTFELPLGPAPREDRPLTVLEVVEGARQLLESSFPVVWVEGEVSGFKTYPSGHWYFTLKDKEAQLRCVMWRSDAQRVPAEPADGLKVYARGSLSVGLKRGDMQFAVRQLIATSEGGFHAITLERARQALERDGLLETSRKRALPRYPRCIGVVTSPEGAAWHDVVAVISRRWPSCELVLIGARVQGEDAPRELVRAVALANRFERIDVLIVGRGGGSKEDLWAFNEERVARAVAASRAPTISAVGHEIDVTLTDLVADERAPTPSAAAERAVPDREELARYLDELRLHLSQAAAGRFELASARLRSAAGRMASALSRRVADAGHRLSAHGLRMGAACERRVRTERGRAERLAAALDALSPLRVLERGYAVARDEAGRVLRRVADFPAGRAFRLRVSDGEVPSRAQEQE
jgi:exodeoxyribonuclease VII large subunit